MRLPIRARTAPRSRPDASASRRWQAEVAELKDKLLRTLADMENLRRRTEREVADSRQYAVDLLRPRDADRRRQSPPRHRSGAAGSARRRPGTSTLIEGVEVTERGLEQTLTKFGVRQIAPQGQKFDPAFTRPCTRSQTPMSPPARSST